MTSYTTFEELKQGTNEVTRTVLDGDLDVDEEEVEPVGVGADDTALGGRYPGGGGSWSGRRIRELRKARGVQGWGKGKGRGL